MQLDAELKESFDLTLDEFDLLSQLRRSRQAVTMSHLAENALVSRASLTRLVDGLTDRGLVERWYDDMDGRRVLVELTEDGVEAHLDAADHYLDAIARLVQRPLRDHDIEAFGDALDSLVDATDPPGHSSQRT